MIKVEAVTSEIKLLAKSEVTYPGMWNLKDVYEEYGAEWEKQVEVSELGSAVVMEYAGRTCYRSFAAKNPKTRATADYLHNILEQNHLSVLEHSSFTFELKNVSRSATHEIVRHRHLSFSQESQRYIDAEKMTGVVIPPALRDNKNLSNILLTEAGLDVEMAQETANVLRKENGLSRKEANEAARAFLPQCIATTIIVTGNARSWLEFITKRLHPAADKELQEIAGKILDILQDTLPEIFVYGADVWSDAHVQLAPKSS